MANPRNVVVLDGQSEGPLTFKADNSTITYDSTKTGGSAAVGLAATLSADSTVALAADGDAIIGRVETVEPSGADAKVTVRCDGVLRFPGGNTATLTLGTKIVGALNPSSAKGYIRSAASATAAELLKGKGQILDAAAATDVAVLF